MFNFLDSTVPADGLLLNYFLPLQASPCGRVFRWITARCLWSGRGGVNLVRDLWLVDVGFLIDSWWCHTITPREVRNLALPRHVVLGCNPSIFRSCNIGRQSDNQIQALYIYIQNCHLKGWETRTTRTPAFSGYSPPPHDYPYYRVILDPKSK